MFLKFVVFLKYFQSCSFSFKEITILLFAFQVKSPKVGRPKEAHSFCTANGTEAKRTPSPSPDRTSKRGSLPDTGRVVF